MKTKNSVKTIFLLIFMALSTSVMFNACKDDNPCDGVDCKNGGICNNGNCACLTGYEGTDCGTETRAKFLAAYNCTNTCFSGVQYQQSISPSSVEVSKMIISNLGNTAGLNVVARATGGSVFTIDNQTVSDASGDSWTISGTGALTGAIVTANVSYTYNPTSQNLTCTESWTKQ